MTSRCYHCVTARSETCTSSSAGFWGLLIWWAHRCSFLSMAPLGAWLGRSSCLVSLVKMRNVACPTSSALEDAVVHNFMRLLLGHTQQTWKRVSCSFIACNLASLCSIELPVMSVSASCSNLAR